MGLIENMTPFIKDALLQIPAEYRDEVSNALVAYYDFENWRLVQNPVVADTPANRSNFIADLETRSLVSRIRQIVHDARARSATADLDENLGI